MDLWVLWLANAAGFEHVSGEGCIYMAVERARRIRAGVAVSRSIHLTIHQSHNSNAIKLLCSEKVIWHIPAVLGVNV